MFTSGRRTLAPDNVNQGLQEDRVKATLAFSAKGVDGVRK